MALQAGDLLGEIDGHSYGEKIDKKELKENEQIK